jgi:predicted DsbA family dithiol-disulfide isomerase
MQIEIWSDVVCPWCYIGKRRFETALAQFPHRDAVEVTWRSFELDPSAPRIRAGDPAERLASKYGMSRAQALQSHARLTSLAAAEGLEFQLQATRSGNTFDAHRLLHLAADLGVQDATKERLFRGYFVESASVGEPDTLVKLVAEAGVPAAAARDVLDSDTYADAVRAEEQEARELGINGVPFFVVDRRYGVSGAQPAEVLRQVLERAWAEAHPLQLLRAGDADADTACTDETCAI